MQVAHPSRRSERHLKAHAPLERRNTRFRVPLQHGEERTTRAKFLHNRWRRPNRAEKEHDVRVAQPRHDGHFLLELVENLRRRRVFALLLRFIVV